MKTRIALIHAVTVAVEPVQAAFRQQWPEAECVNILDDSLSLDRERDRVLTEAMKDRIRALAEYAAVTGRHPVHLLGFWRGDRGCCRPIADPGAQAQ